MRQRTNKDNSKSAAASKGHVPSSYVNNNNLIHDFSDEAQTQLKLISLAENSPVVVKHAKITQLVANTDVIQRKPATWTLKVGIKYTDNKVKQTSIEIDYDDESAGLKVSKIKEALESKFGVLYTIELIYLGTNNQRNNDLKNSDYILSADAIRLGGNNYLAVMKEVENDDEKEEVQKARENWIIKKGVLSAIVDDFGFEKIVTGNHIHGASDPESEQINAGVKSQQIDETSGKTLFIDPAFKAPGNEKQYHDIVIEDGGEIVDSKPNAGLYVVKSKDSSVYIGVLSRGVYTDEVDELDVTCKHYIHETRPQNIIKE